ncbi:aKG-HExxH-type peptide beta-hydroxylase [Nonomuraea endophytica]|uniref:aKG-HExxH-type peptide beta-hydroxylase n=1 Tax=Nonomuraea endophytica TaxID=714136 RepID=UPI0037C8F63B
MAHSLADAELEELATGLISAALTERLAGAELSKHKLLFEAVRRHAATESAQAVRLLGEIEREHPRVVAQLLALPQVGVWAVECLHQLRLGGAGEWGYLERLAASGAFRAGRSVPDMQLPGLGTIACQRLTALPRISAGNLSVILDDEDPYFRIFGERERPNIERWQAGLGAAWELLDRLDTPSTQAMAAGVTTLVPLRAGRFVSATSAWAWGAIAMSAPDDPVRVAEALVHEFHHLALNAADDITRLTRPGDTTLWRPPWRADPRPLLATFQGCYAFTAVAGFWRDVLRAGPPEQAGRARAQFERWSAGTLATADAIADTPGLTSAGRHILYGVRTRLRTWIQ